MNQKSVLELLDRIDANTLVKAEIQSILSRVNNVLGYCSGNDTLDFKSVMSLLSALHLLGKKDLIKSGITVQQSIYAYNIISSFSNSDTQLYFMDPKMDILRGLAGIYRLKISKMLNISPDLTEFKQKKCLEIIREALNVCPEELNFIHKLDRGEIDFVTNEKFYLRQIWLNIPPVEQILVLAIFDLYLPVNLSDFLLYVKIFYRVDLESGVYSNRILNSIYVDTKKTIIKNNIYMLKSDYIDMFTKIKKMISEGELELKIYNKDS